MRTPQTPQPSAQVPAWRLRARQVTQEPVDVAQADPGQGAKGVGVSPPWAVDPVPASVNGSRTAHPPHARTRDAKEPHTTIRDNISPRMVMDIRDHGCASPQAGGPNTHAKEMGTSVQDVHTAPTSSPLELPAGVPLGPELGAQVAQLFAEGTYSVPPVADLPADPAPGETLARTVTYETAGAPWNGGGSGTLGTPPTRPMPNTPREVKTTRVRQCMALMASGRWVRGVTNVELAGEWGLDPHTVTDIATQASRVLECIDLPGGNIRGALLAQVTVLQDAVMACVVGPDGKGPEPERAAQLFTAAKGVLELHMKAWGMLTGNVTPALPSGTGEGTARGPVVEGQGAPSSGGVEPLQGGSARADGPEPPALGLAVGTTRPPAGADGAKRLSAKDMRARLLDAVAELDAEIARDAPTPGVPAQGGAAAPDPVP